MEYTKTTLWIKSLADCNDNDNPLKKNLREAFAKAHENASFILEKIRLDFPSLTVHNITHVDGLWQVGSVIAGETYELTPLEGFVLGCAFLMHDAVLSYDAVGGRNVLRNKLEWKDFYADYKKDTTLNSQEQLYETDFRTIRLLHAKYAENLYSQKFFRDNGTPFYIIEDESLRKHLGPIICKIAASHHWNIDDVEKLGIQQPAPAEYPVSWRINPIKLACLIRCADAGHIDAGRAPDYLLKLLAINGISRNHWIAQNRLSQIDTDMQNKEKVVISSNISFKESDFAAWNVANDAVQVLDHEIKISNALLKKYKINQFQAKGVSGAESRQNLSQYIQTDGWIPCDTNIHISNVEGLIKNIGGEKLYGKEYKLEVALRELIQNARDSIVARRQREVDFDGKINIVIELIDGKTWVSVKDNGVGMSLQTIKDYFLNFGSSFWASDLAKSEYPGLNSSGFKSVGRFGIGFYAIFMVASEVLVETRKFDQGLDNNIKLRFPNGLCLRPILSKIRGADTSISTIVRFSIDGKKCKWKNFMMIKPSINKVPPFSVPYASVLSNLTAGLDVDVYYSELGITQKIHTNIGSSTLDIAQWLKDITYASYHDGSKYVDYINNNYHRIRKVYYNGECYGLAALNTLYKSQCSYFDITTIGGLSNFSHQSGFGEFLGCLFAEPETAKRNGNVADIYKTDWAKDQYNILCKQGLTDMDRLHLPYFLGKYGIDMTDVMEIRVISKSNKISQIELGSLLMKLKNDKKKLVLPLSSFDSNRIENYLDYQRTLEKINVDELLFITEDNSNFLNINDNDTLFSFNLLHCIKIIAQKKSLKISIANVDNKSVSPFDGKAQAIVISIS
jgi:PKD repeat protein